jgi:uncharacterized protein YegP (UPF0339 family)
MRTPKFEIYRDSKSEFRWRLKAPNGRIIAESGEGYKRKEACEDALELLIYISTYNHYRIIDKTKP